MLKSHKDLIVWQKSMSLVTSIYKLTASFPSTEQFGLISQMRCAAVSIPSNIAEGRSRGTRKDFRQFINIAFGSTNELETQLLIALDLNFVTTVEFKDIHLLIEEISKMLRSISSKLEANS